VKVIKPAAINALIEALTHIYWRKKHFKRFLLNAISNQSIKTRISAINWDHPDNTKREIATQLVEDLTADQGRYFDELLSLIENVLEFRSFPHLENEREADDKIAKAVISVKALREISKGYFDEIQKKKEIDKLREKARLNRKQKVQQLNQLTALNDRFNALVCSDDSQKKGYELEKLMYDLFKVFNLDPSPSFKRDFDQIDGAFSLNSTEYLFEAKWTAHPIRTNDLTIFNSKIEESTLENTLGVFLSINGFTNEARSRYANRRTSVILIEGIDLMPVLKGDIGFDELIEDKKKQASRLGKQ